MNYYNLNCTQENVNDVTFYKFRLDNINVKCFVYNNSPYCNISDLTEDVEESIKNLLLDKYKKIIVEAEASEFSGTYVEDESFITIISWVRQDLYKIYIKFIYYVNLYFTLENLSGYK